MGKQLHDNYEEMQLTKIYEHVSAAFDIVHDLIDEGRCPELSDLLDDYYGDLHQIVSSLYLLLED